MFTIYGPVGGAKVQVPGRWTVELTDTVAAGDAVTVSTLPWARSVTRSNGANAGDYLTRNVPPLHTLTLPPGPFTVHFGGTSGDGTCRFTWRDARRSP